MVRRRSGVRGRRAIVLLLGLAVVGLLIASPRHRQVYSRLFPGASEAPSSRGLVLFPPRGSSAPVAPAQREQSAAPGPQTRVADGPRGGLSSGPAVPSSGSGDRVAVEVSGTPPIKLPSLELPPEWNLKEFMGRAQVEVVREDSRLAFRLISRSTSFALYRDVVVDLKRFPILTWRWKVLALPTGGDVRQRTTDDQAAQVYLVFPRWPSPRINSDVMGYIWDSSAPVGAKLTSPQSANVRVVVLQSGAERLGQWVREERHIHQDYVELFGREPPRLGQVALMADSDNTRSRAEALIEDLVFLQREAQSARPR